MLTNDPDGATVWQVDVQWSKGRQACALNVQDVLSGLEGVWFAAKVEGEIRKVGNLVAFNGVLAIPGLLGTNLSVEHFSDVGGEGNQRGT